jgi:hypothetical protein
MRRTAQSLLLAATILAAGCAGEPPTPTPTPEPTPAKLNVARSLDLSADPDEVFAVVGDFGGIDKYMDGIEKVDLEGEGVGAVRTLTLADGAKVVETLTALDAEAMTLSYAIQESPLPVDGYQATMKVSALEGGGSRVDWSSTFTARGASDADAEEAIASVYDAGLAGLAKLFPEKTE